MLMETISVIIVDDHPLFRQGVADTLSLETDFQIIGQAETGEEGLALIRAKLPTVAVIDVNLPGLNGQQLTRQVVGEKIPTRVLLLTAYDDAEQRIHAMRVGAAAYCTKDIKPEKLVDIIRQIANGKYVVGENVIEGTDVDRWISMHIDGAIRHYSDPGEPYIPLSAREMEVLTYVTKGLSNKEIAFYLGISHQTVKNHVTAILRKLGVDDRTQATVYALRRGWVRLNDLELEKQE
jgi:two-component system, NarL family, response regulator DegU